MKVKWSRYRLGVAQRVGRGIALLLHDRGTRRWWVVNSTPRPHFTPGKHPVPILQKAGWAPRPVWTCGKSRPHRDSIPDRPARSSVAIRSELPCPHTHTHTHTHTPHTHTHHTHTHAHTPTHSHTSTHTTHTHTHTHTHIYIYIIHTHFYVHSEDGF